MCSRVCLWTSCEGRTNSSSPAQPKQPVHSQPPGEKANSTPSHPQRTLRHGLGKLKEADYPFVAQRSRGRVAQAIVFFVGGTTYEEAKTVAFYNELHPGRGTVQRVLWGTRLSGAHMCLPFADPRQRHALPWAALRFTTLPGGPLSPPGTGRLHSLEHPPGLARSHLVPSARGAASSQRWALHRRLPLDTRCGG